MRIELVGLEEKTCEDGRHGKGLSVGQMDYLRPHCVSSASGGRRLVLSVPTKEMPVSRIARATIELRSTAFKRRVDRGRLNGRSFLAQASRVESRSS